MSSLFIYVGYVAGIVFFAAGVFMLTGLVFSKDIPAQLKYVMGITLLLYGVYRMITTYFKSKQIAKLSKDEDDSTKHSTIL